MANWEEERKGVQWGWGGGDTQAAPPECKGSVSSGTVEGGGKTEGGVSGRRGQWAAGRLPRKSRTRGGGGQTPSGEGAVLWMRLPTRPELPGATPPPQAPAKAAAAAAAAGCVSLTPGAC